MNALLRRYWRELALALAGVWILAGFYAGHREDVQEATKPMYAQEVKRADKWPERVAPGCQPVIEKVLPTKEAERIEREFGVSVGSGTEGVPEPGTTVPTPRVLGLFDVPTLNYGGEALALLNPDGHTTLTVKPSPPPFVSFRPTWGLGAAVDPLAWRESWTAYALVEPLHFRERWHLRGTAGIESRDGQTGVVLGLGLEWRSR